MSTNEAQSDQDQSAKKEDEKKSLTAAEDVKDPSTVTKETTKESETTSSGIKTATAWHLIG